MKQLAGQFPHFFQMRREDLLLASEIPIQRQQKFVPRSLVPGQFSVVRAQFGRGIQFAACSVCYKIKVGAAVIISCRALQRVTDPGGKSEKPDRWRRTCERIPENQMHVNAREHHVVGDAVNDAPFAALPSRQTRELTVRVIQRIGANMQHHAHDVDAQIPIKIKVPRNHAANAGQQAHSRGRYLESREKLGQPKPYWPVKIEVENALHLACLIGGFDARTKRLGLLRHRFTRQAQALCFCSNAGTSVSSRMFSASSKSARVCLAVTQARKQIRFCGTAG